MVIYKYYINEKYNASALTWGCCYSKHGDVLGVEFGAVY